MKALITIVLSLFISSAACAADLETMVKQGLARATSSPIGAVTLGSIGSEVKSGHVIFFQNLKATVANVGNLNCMVKVDESKGRAIFVNCTGGKQGSYQAY